MRVIKFNNDKTSTISYHKKESFKPNYLVNPNHIFLAKGYTTILITDKSPETINPLDFESKYPLEMFETAINTKIIKDTFETIKTKGIDLALLIAGGSLLANLVIIYLLLQSLGII